MLLGRPEFLWLLPWVLLQLPLTLRSAGQRRWVAGGIRVACAAALMLALCHPAWKLHDEERRAIVLLDMGPTMAPQSATVAGERFDALKKSRPLENVRLVVFSNRSEHVDDLSTLTSPARLAALKARIEQPLWPDDPPHGGSALASALQLAGSQMDAGGGSIELISNGLVTRGDAEAEAYRLARKGVQIHVTQAAVQLPLTAPQLFLQDAKVSGFSRVGESVPVGITVETAIPQRVTLLASTAGGVPVRIDTNLPVGISHFSPAVPIAATGLISIEVTLRTAGSGASDLVASRQTATFADRSARVVLVQPPGAAVATAASLASLLKQSADIREVSPQQLDDLPLEKTDVLVLANVPMNAIPPSSQLRIQQAVLDGMGLLVSGGASSFNPGDQKSGPLAAVLPVRTDPKTESLDPSTALVLIIDTSGSMQGEKLDLAKDVARLALSHLGSQDKVGLVEFYGGKRWAAPLQSAANAAVINRALARLTASGGTTLYPAVEEAEFALHNVFTQTKHVLIISDGFVENAPFATLCREMADDGIAVSAAAVKADPLERNLMPSIAMWGRGRYYTVPDRFAVPDISLKQRSLSPEAEVNQTPSAVTSGTDALLREISASGWGVVGEHTRTVARGNADVLLKTVDGDPLLVRRRYGNGWAAAMTTTIGSTSRGDLQSSAPFAQLMADLFRQIGSASRNVLMVTPTVRPAGVELDITAATLDPHADDRLLHLEVYDPQGHRVRVSDIEPIAPRHWNVLLEGLLSGIYRASVRTTTLLSGDCAFTVQPPRVFALAPDHALLERLQQFPVQGPARPADTAGRWIDLRKPLVLIAIALLLIHVGVRRWPVLLPPRLAEAAR